MTPTPDPLPKSPIDDFACFGRPRFYYYPVDYGSLHHPSFAYILCSEFSTVPPAHILNWYFCAFNLYVSPLSIALQTYNPTGDLYPVKLISKSLPLSDSAVSDYETFVSKSKTDPSYHGWFNQTDFKIVSLAGLFTSNIDADDRQTIETVNIYYLCLLTLAMFKDQNVTDYSNWMETTANKLKTLLQNAGSCKLFPTLGNDFKAQRLNPMFAELEFRPEFRAKLMKSFIDLVFACRDGTTTSTFVAPFDYVIKMLKYSSMSLVPQIKANIIDVSHPIRHASFIKKEILLFEELQKDLDALGQYGPFAKILDVMPDCCHRTNFPNLLAACTLICRWDERSLDQLNLTKRIHCKLISLLEDIVQSHVKLEKLTARQVRVLELKAKDISFPHSKLFKKNFDNRQ